MLWNRGRMRKIKTESIKVGDWLILIRKEKKKGSYNYNYLIKIVDENIQLTNYVAKSVKWWLLDNKSLEDICHIEPSKVTEVDNPCCLSEREFKGYHLYRLNKKEIKIINKKIILNEL